MLILYTCLSASLLTIPSCISHCCFCDHLFSFLREDLLVYHQPHVSEYIFISFLLLLGTQFCEVHNSRLTLNASPHVEGTHICLLAALLEPKIFPQSYCHTFEDYLFFLSDCFKNIFVFGILKIHHRTFEGI